MVLQGGKAGDVSARALDWNWAVRGHDGLDWTGLFSRTTTGGREGGRRGEGRSWAAARWLSSSSGTSWAVDGVAESTIGGRAGQE